MKTIRYRVFYSGVVNNGSASYRLSPAYEYVDVQTRDINSGFRKALKTANEPLGSGARREIAEIKFWAVQG